MNEFERGFANATAVVEAPVGEGKLDSDAFLDRWKRARPAKRAFLTYTKADNRPAQYIAKAMEANGFVTFTYLNEEGRLRYSADTAGKLYRQATRRYFLDTKNSQASHGVWFEIKHEVSPHDTGKPIKEKRKKVLSPFNELKVDPPRSVGSDRPAKRRPRPGLPRPEDLERRFVHPNLVHYFQRKYLQREQLLRTQILLSIDDKALREFYLDQLSKLSSTKHRNPYQALKGLERFEWALEHKHGLRPPAHRRGFMEPYKSRSPRIHLR